MRVMVLLSPRAGKKARILLCLIIVTLLAAPLARALLLRTNPTVVPGLPLAGKTFVIDPGHGGYDPGVIRNNVEEKIVALSISLFLRDYLQSAGARVVMTRETDRDLLVIPTAGPKKKQDMKNRLKIIREANPHMLISVHANSISSQRWQGAQVFFKPDCENSKLLAGVIQQELIRFLANTDRVIKPGNYLVLIDVDMPAVLVETGFISNPVEARQLVDPEYQSKVAWAVYLGITRYYSELDK